MREIHELLGRPLDPIADVRHKFEKLYTEDYFNPVNGDWISDDYWDIIDLTTKPGTLSEIEVRRLNLTIARLNGKYGHIQRRLGDSSLLGAYVDVAEQVTAINSARGSEADILPMHGAPKEALPEINEWIAMGNNSSRKSWDVLLGHPDELGLGPEFYYTEAQHYYQIAGRLGGVGIMGEASGDAA